MRSRAARVRDGGLRGGLVRDAPARRRMAMEMGDGVVRGRR